MTRTSSEKRGSGNIPYVESGPCHAYRLIPVLRGMGKRKRKARRNGTGLWNRYCRPHGVRKPGRAKSQEMCCEDGCGTAACWCSFRVLGSRASLQAGGGVVTEAGDVVARSVDSAREQHACVWQRLSARHVRWREEDGRPVRLKERIAPQAYGTGSQYAFWLCGKSSQQRVQVQAVPAMERTAQRLRVPDGRTDIFPMGSMVCVAHHRAREGLGHAVPAGPVASVVASRMAVPTLEIKPGVAAVALSRPATGSDRGPFPGAPGTPGEPERTWPSIA